VKRETRHCFSGLAFSECHVIACALHSEAQTQRRTSS